MSGIRIGQNVSSLGVLRQLARGSEQVNRSIERLSSGLRINHASDDPAGVAVSSALNAQTRLYSQATRNASDGLSLLSIADGALNELSAVVTRQKELAEQASNGVYTSKQREALNNEAAALTSEYDRILASTQFNGVSLFTTNGTTIRIQTGKGLEESTLITLPGSQVERLAGDGTFTYSASYALHSGSGWASTADVNGDGDLDLVGHGNNFGNPFIKAYLGDGTGSFTGATSAAFAGDGTGNIAFGDFNGDGRLDVVDISQNTSAAAFFAGNGDGTFATGVTFTVGSGPLSITSADFNGDGRLDIATANYYDGQIVVRHGNGNGTFGGPTTLSGTNGPFQVQSADLNGDGAADIVATEFGGSNRTQVYYGNNNGTFQASVATPTVSSINVSRLGDVDGDGRVDIITGASTGFIVFQQAANGTFNTSFTIASPGESAAVNIADINGDGKLDLISGDASNNVFVRFGNGDFTFSAPTSSAPGIFTNYGVSFGDFNGDGVNDIYSVGSDRIQVALGGASISGGPPPPIDLTTQTSAREALELTTARLDSLASQRSTIGASMSRLTVVISNLQSRVENYEAANSRILSVDFAEEAAQLARQNIIQQVGISVLAQANLQPQLVLQLLKP